MKFDPKMRILAEFRHFEMRICYFFSYGTIRLSTVVICQDQERTQGKLIDQYEVRRMQELIPYLLLDPQVVNQNHEPLL